jgi:predicted  nucleic acid-binding Zn-ribbon protein
MTYRCSKCDVNWYVFMTIKGACPSCGGGTKRTQEPASPNAKQLHEALKAKGRAADAHDRFETYYADRERARDAAQATEAIDSLEIIAKLPTRDPEAS